MKQLPDDFDYDAVKDVREAARRVRDHLESSRMSTKLGAPLLQLIGKVGWITGSHVWRPCLDMPLDMASDVDMIFSNNVSMQSAMMLLRGTRLYDETSNKFGNPRFLWAGTSKTAVDLWVLEDGESIVECIMGFGQRHEHVAYAMGVPVDVALVRMTHVHYDDGRSTPKLVMKTGPGIPISSGLNGGNMKIKSRPPATYRP